MKKFDAEKIIFDKFTGFELSYIPTTPHWGGVYCKPCLQPISCYELRYAGTIIADAIGTNKDGVDLDKIVPPAGTIL